MTWERDHPIEGVRCQFCSSNLVYKGKCYRCMRTQSTGREVLGGRVVSNTQPTKLAAKIQRAGKEA